VIFGQDRAVAQFRTAWDSGAMHHAWLLAGPRGVGKGTFARGAAARVLADAAGPRSDLPGLDVPDENNIAKLIAAGSHPDLRLLERLENEKTGNLARNISVDQVRGLGDLFDFTPALSDWRVVIIDAADDLERSAANALLKMLEEPPPNCLFLLVSHAPGRLLPTIRSRCRRLEFQALDDDAMAAILDRSEVAIAPAKRPRVIAAAAGSAGRALAVAELDLAPLQDKVLAILRDGDPTNARRAELAQELGKKGAAERYAAFLDLVPSLIAQEARQASGGRRARALEAYAKSTELAGIAPRLSLDPAATIFQIGAFLAAVP
jgi:DNA polymerase-3 subunit delta'